MLKPSFMTRLSFERASAGGAPAPRRPAARTTTWRSFHQHAAIDVEALAVDEAGGIREQEQDGVRDLFRLAEAAQRNSAGDHRAACAMARPIPDAAPVTTMTRSRRFRKSATAGHDSRSRHERLSRMREGPRCAGPAPALWSAEQAERRTPCVVDPELPS